MKSDLKVVLGVAVRLRRNAARISQEELAAQCDIFRTYLSRIENGTANPTITVIAALAAALKVQASVLLTE